MHGAEAAKGQAMSALGNFVLNVAGGEHGFGAIAEFGFVETALDLALASGQALAYGSFHSKPPYLIRATESATSLRRREKPGVSSFFQEFSPLRPTGYAWLRI